MKGKAYANKKKKENRPIGDFYSTPKSLVWVVEDIIDREFEKQKHILEPSCGRDNKEPIVDVLYSWNYNLIINDLYHNCGGYNYIKKERWTENQIITNPPFSLWDEFVLKAKTHCKKFMFIGRLNYFGCSGRNISENNCNGCKHYLKYGYCAKNDKVVSKVKDSQCVKTEYEYNFKNSFIWKFLKGIYPFSRYVDYQTPYREDGLFHVGNMATAWFLWDMEYKGKIDFKVLDVQKYSKLGVYKEDEI